MNSEGKWALLGVGVAGVALAAIIVGAVVRTPTSCTASLRISTVDVRLTGDTARAADVRLCTTGGCSGAWAFARAGAGTAGGSSASPATPGPVPGASPIPDATPLAELPPETPPPAAITGGALVPAPTALWLPARPLHSDTATHSDSPMHTGTATHPDRWTFATDQHYPARVEVVAYDATGRRVAEREVSLTWRSSGNVCDTTKVTGAVTLNVAS